MIQTLTRSEIKADEWQQLVESSDTASFFQTKECFDFYSDLSFLTPFLYGVAENGVLVGIACGYIVSEENKLVSYFSKRAIIPGGVLLDNEISNNALSKLLNTLKDELKSKAIYIEIRNYSDYSSRQTTFEDASFSYQTHLNIWIATSDSDKALSGLSESKRRQLKKAIKNGAIALPSTDKKQLTEFYQILQNLYKRKIRKPLFPFEFFEKLLAQDFAHFIVVTQRKKVIGGIICVELKGKILYEWFVAGNDRENKEAYPSLLATWSAIEYATENKFEYFDFMGAGKPEKGYGVREFKSRFGGKTVEYGRFLYICKPFRYKLGQLAMSGFYKDIGDNHEKRHPAESGNR